MAFSENYNPDLTNSIDRKDSPENANNAEERINIANDTVNKNLTTLKKFPDFGHENIAQSKPEPESFEVNPDTFSGNQDLWGAIFSFENIAKNSENLTSNIDFNPELADSSKAKPKDELAFLNSKEAPTPEKLATILAGDLNLDTNNLGEV